MIYQVVKNLDSQYMYEVIAWLLCSSAIGCRAKKMRRSEDT